MIAAGVNAKALSTYTGHSSITMKLDRYGHLNSVRRATASSRSLARIGPGLALEGCRSG